MFFLIWFLILAVFYGIRFLILKTNLQISNKTYVRLLYIHITSLTLLLISFILYFYDLSFRGYDSTSFIFICTGITGMLLYLFRNKNHLSRAFNYMLTGISVFAVPIVVCYTCRTINEYKENVYYEDQTFRLETTFKGIIAPRTFPDLFIKSFLLEKKYKLDIEPINYIHSATMTKFHTDSIQITVYHSVDTSSATIIRIKE